MGQQKQREVPIRADMATIINTPTGVSESSLMAAPTMPSAKVLQRRDKMKEMLLDRLCKELGGGDPLCKSLIAREVEGCTALKAGTLSADGLAKLEAACKKAITAATQQPLQSMAPPRNTGDVLNNPRKDYSMDLKSVATWTDVAHHRAGFYSVQQQQQANQKEQRRCDLREQLGHQMAEARRGIDARANRIKAEQAEVNKQLDDYARDMAAAQQKRKEKIRMEMKTRAEQAAETKARRAAAEQLQRLEDEELLRMLEAAKQADRDALAAKKKAQEEYHRQTAIANAAARELREQKKQEEAEEDRRLNEEWKAMLDERENTRLAQIAALKQRIEGQQRVYEDNTGAQEAARAAQEEATRKMWMDKYEQEALERETRERADRQRKQNETTRYIKAQMGENMRLLQIERQQELERAKMLKQESELAEKQRIEQKAKEKALALTQQRYLSEQIQLQKKQALSDPASAQMTPLEASLNRSLLVSMVEKKYEGVHVLN